MKLKKCSSCGSYSLKEKCKCGEENTDAHYKFVKIRDAPKGDAYWGKKKG
jgi:rRNA maturation protein Nop10